MTAGLDARLLSLGGGAWRTLAGHVRRFERLGAIYYGPQLFLLALDLFAQALRLAVSQVCATVVPNVVATCSWILKRIGMFPLTVPSPLLASSVSRLGTETRALKEAVPVPSELIKLLEEQVVPDSTECQTDAILGWFVLIAIFASVRFDDLL